MTTPEPTAPQLCLREDCPDHHRDTAWLRPVTQRPVYLAGLRRP